MASLMTSFRKRLMVVMIFFSMAPILLFGIYAYEDLSNQREDAFERGFYYAFLNDFQKLNVWLEGKKLNIVSDGKLHFLSKEGHTTTGSREGRNYEIIIEGTEDYQRLEVENQEASSDTIITKFVNYNATEQIVDERTMLVVYVKDLDLKSGKHYYIKEEIHLKELVLNLEKALNDKFISYSIFVNGKILFTQNRVPFLDPYNAYYNRGSYTTISNASNQYMGLYSGNDPLGIHVAVFRDYSFAIEQIKTYQWEFFIRIFVVGVFGALLSMLLARKLNYPIQKLKSAVEDILKGDIESRIEVNVHDEFGQIYESFNRLAEIETSNYKKMLDSGIAIGDKNKQLIELNRELHMSYDQLREAMGNLDLSKNKQEALINNIGELIWTMNAEGVITFVNQSVFEKLGYRVEDVLGQSITILLAEFESGKTLESFLEEIQYVDIENTSVNFVKKDSEERVFMLMNTKRIYEDMALRSIQGFARPISDDWVIHHMTLKRNKEMEITSQISWVLANNILLDELLEQIVKKIEQLLHADLCLIGLMENEDSVIAKIGGTYGQRCGKVSLAISSDIFIELLETHNMIRGDELFQSFRAANEAVYEYLQDYVVLPLRFDRKIIGFFCIASGKKFSESDLRVLEIISNQSAIAIDKAQLYKTLKIEYLNTIRVLATAVEAKDSYTEGHSYRVSKIAKLIAEKISDVETFVEEIEISGILHDIGKIGIFDQILTKRGRLSQEEYYEIQQHPAIGYKIIEPIQLSQPIIDGILLHHKRYDLKGYPHDIKIGELPLSAGIIGVADALDAITSTRSYSNAKELVFAMEEIDKHKGTQFHPIAANAILQVFADYPEKLIQIINEEP